MYTNLYLLRIDYKSSYIGVREKFAFLNHEIIPLLACIKSEIGAAVCLSTCNRTEIYISSNQTNRDIVKEKIRNIISILKNINKNFIEEHTQFESDFEIIVNHIFEVSSGLESMILGEGQILNQVKNAYLQSKNFTDPLLNQLFQKALSVGKKVRTQTSITKGAVSVPSVAIETIKTILFNREENIRDKNFMIFGRGEVAELFFKILNSEGIENIIQVNRSQAEHEHINKYKIKKHISYSELSEHIFEQDIILVCTAAPHFIISTQMLTGLNKQLILADISLPRNIDPAVEKNHFVKLLDLDTFKNNINKNIQNREFQVSSAKKIIKLEIIKLKNWQLGGSLLRM